MVDLLLSSIRNGLAELPRADHHKPGERVDPASVFTPPSHRNALDPERALVVGNRGMGKSFWAHALLEKKIRELVAEQYRQPGLDDAMVVIGFNAADQGDIIAPAPHVLSQIMERDQPDPETIWRAVLVRATASFTGLEIPKSFVELVKWIDADAERHGSLMSDADQELGRRGKKLLVVFDALERLGQDWTSTRELTRGLLRRALATKSYRAIRLKLFMRPDQFEDQTLFEFPDASKIKNDRVELDWQPTELYGLLFDHLKRSPQTKDAFERLVERLHVTERELSTSQEHQKRVVDALAGAFMGTNKKRGRIYSWLPLHLADARGQTSPRTFLTVWREAARQGSRPSQRAVDHHGISDGVRKASGDRLSELREDYPWIGTLLEPLRGKLVPMEQSVLDEIWRKSGTVAKLIAESKQNPRTQAPVQLVAPPQEPTEAALLTALRVIGVLEIRSNGKINVPDIFRVEAGIKRKGGVKPPKRSPGP